MGLLVLLGARSVIADGGPVAVPEPSPEALRFHRSGIWLWFLGRFWALAVPTIILFTGASSRIRRAIEGRGRAWWLVVCLYGGAYLTLDFLVGLPLRYYGGFVRLHAYGLSVESLSRWLGDAFKGLGLSVVCAGLFLWIPYRLMARSPRFWWLWVGLLTLPFSAGGAYLTPIVVAPLFNHFGPMTDKALETRIEALAWRSGIDGARIFEVDKSQETTTVNAYVTGLAGTKRIVLWDTLLGKLDDDEVLAVMAHEMGHYVLNHVALGLALGVVGTVFALGMIHLAATRLIQRFHARFGFDRLGDVASVPLLLMLAQVTILVGSPVGLACSRWMEHEADRFGLEITRDNHAAASSFARLQQTNLAIPDPGWLSVVWRSSHPPLGDRIAFCNGYRPWASGEPSRYAHLFRGP